MREISGWAIGCIVGGILLFLSVFSSNYPMINVVVGVIFFICAIVIQVAQIKVKKMTEDITDEMAIDHFKKMVLGRIPLEKQKSTYVVVGTKKYPLSDVAKHMEARDEIGKLEIEIEKEHMRFLRKGR